MTKQAKHTAGPWFVCSPGGMKPSHEKIIQADLGVNASGILLVSTIAFMSGNPGDEQTEANARLIAAAPELLEALKLYDAWAALPQDRGGSLGSKGQARLAFIKAKDAAISKAEGK